LTQGAARFLGNVLARVTMAVDVDFRESGNVFFRGNTAALGLPADCDGTWKVLSADADTAQIEIVVDGKPLPAKILFHDADEFTLKAEVPVPPGGNSAANQAGAAVASNPGGPAANRPQPPAAQADPNAPPKKQMTAIVFKRN
jgi:hypothetical protein